MFVCICPDCPWTSIALQCRIMAYTHSFHVIRICFRYRESGHCDFVKGLAWHPDGRLFTCGWDQRINKAAPYPNMENQLIDGTKAVNLEGMDTVETSPTTAQE